MRLCNQHQQVLLVFPCDSELLAFFLLFCAGSLWNKRSQRRYYENIFITSHTSSAAAMCRSPRASSVGFTNRQWAEVESMIQSWSFIFDEICDANKVLRKRIRGFARRKQESPAFFFSFSSVMCFKVFILKKAAYKFPCKSSEGMKKGKVNDCHF